MRDVICMLLLCATAQGVRIPTNFVSRGAQTEIPGTPNTRGAQTEIPGTPNTLPTTFQQNNIDQADFIVVATGSSLQLESPGYPDSYPAGANDQWRFRPEAAGGQLQLSCPDLQLASGDQLVVIEGAQVTPVTEQGQVINLTGYGTLLVSLRSGGAAGGGRFQCVVSGAAQDPSSAAEEDPVALRESAVCGTSAVRNRISTGIVAVPGEFPWIAGITLRERSSRDFIFCSATIVSDFFLVTAAHCIRIYEAADLDVLVGKHARDPENSQTRLAVVEVLRHPGNIPFTSENDIALLRVSHSMEPLYAGGRVRPVCLQQPPCEVTPASCLVGRNATIAGWGIVRHDSLDFPAELLKAQLPILDNRQCRRRYASLRGVSIFDSMICAGNPLGGSDTCQGDSGGPLMVRREDGSYLLAGVVSFGRGCGQSGYPGVYTRVSEFVNWIMTQLAAFQSTRN